MGIQETHTIGFGVMGSESEVWEGMEGRVVWCGVDDKSKGRVCSPKVSKGTRVWEGIEAHGWKASRIVWRAVKIGIVKYV